MKSQVLISFLLFAVTLVWSGCVKDSEDISDPGREAFLGAWVVTPVKKMAYDVTIVTDSNSADGVFIRNFALAGWQYTGASAVIQGKKIVLDNNQVIGTGLTINGSGTLSGNTITWQYTIFDGADLTNVSEIYTKK